MANGMKRENKTRQTAVKYSPSFEARLKGSIGSPHTPLSAMFLDMIELAVEYSERTRCRLEDVPAKIRQLCEKESESEPTECQKQVEPETRSAMGTVKRTITPPKQPPLVIKVDVASSGEALSNDLESFVKAGATSGDGDAQA